MEKPATNHHCGSQTGVQVKGVLVFMRIYMSAIAERLHEDIKADVIMIIIFKDMQTLQGDQSNNALNFKFMTQELVIRCSLSCSHHQHR